MVSACANERDQYETTFSHFVKTLTKTFITLTIIVMAMSLKSRLITSNTTLFYSALFIIGGSLLLSILATVDQYVYNNVILGIGLALGLQMMDWRLNP
jgi:uncharacterized protein YebE (UPF0316 family)|tara:strand:+ start:851 stop:1144 length:294 start_codon:yes stop_codon:yes gene_type:complete